MQVVEQRLEIDGAEVVEAAEAGDAEDLEGLAGLVLEDLEAGEGASLVDTGFLKGCVSRLL